MNKKRKILVICGPTATGKTRIALKLAKKFDAELVSADSRQVYRGMDIVTGKDLESRKKIDKLRLNISHNGTVYELVPYAFHGVPLWMYDVVFPDQPFSVSQYQCLAGAIISAIQKKNTLPIVVGGTGFYIRSIIRPIETVSVMPDLDLRKKLIQMSLEELQEKLQSVNSEMFKNLNESDRQNPRRLIRKIEICLSKDTVNKKYPKLYDDICIIGLTARMHYIYEKIDERVHSRMNSGAFEEVRMLQSRYGFDIPSMSGLGYKEWKEYFSDSNVRRSKEEVIKRWKYDEHAYGRRQMTWFRKEKGIHWFDIENPNVDTDIVSLVREWYTKE